jgi:hypothetical protein
MVRALSWTSAVFVVVTALPTATATATEMHWMSAAFVAVTGTWRAEFLRLATMIRLLLALIIHFAILNHAQAVWTKRRAILIQQPRYRVAVFTLNCHTRTAMATA